MKIIIAGGTGFLGNCLTRHFKEGGHQVVILTRGQSHTVNQVQYIQWDASTLGSWTAALDGADVLINLNGKSVDCRYTEKNKALIYSTRLESTAALGQAIEQITNPPKVWINSASATIYRHSVDKEMDESTGEIGSGFSVDVCKQWEQVFNSFTNSRTRKILIRTGIVIGRNGGPLKPLKILAKIGMGSKQGSGNQYFSWLHEDDFVSIIDFLIENQVTQGAYNVTAPTPIPNRQFMRGLRKAVKMPFGIGLPKWILEFGAMLIGTETELILKSRRVIPKRLVDEGYQFKFNTIEGALDHLLKN